MSLRTNRGRGSRYAAAGVLLLSLAVAACSSGSSTSSTSSKSSSSASASTANYGLVSKGHISAATLQGEEGFSNEVNGTWTGFSVSLIQEAAKGLGLGSGITYTGFSNNPAMESAVGSHQYDVCACALTITAAREKINGFTEPYYWGFDDLMMKKSAPAKTLSQLSGQTVGVGIGTEQEAVLKASYPKITIKTYDNPLDAVVGLVAGQVDAALNGGTSSGIYEKSYPTLRVAQTVPQSAGIGFPVPKNEPSLKAALNQQITAAIKNGSWLKLYKQVFPGEPVVEPFLKLYPELKQQGA
jgi:polar amino acid transport system substrate-binding protein